MYGTFLSRWRRRMTNEIEALFSSLSPLFNSVCLEARVYSASSPPAGKPREVVKVVNSISTVIHGIKLKHNFVGFCSL